MKNENSILVDIDKLPINPTFYIFKGVSGAGCSTAINQVCDKGLVQLSPPEFTTRPLRPGEKRGHRHHSITSQQLDRVRHQMATHEPSYGNEYGFFKPAIKKMQRMLQTHNVIVDSATPPLQWQEILGNNYSVASLFFAPQSPFAAVERIVGRAQEQKDDRLKEYLLARAVANAQVITGITDFDFWIDTTDFDTVFPSVEAVIKQISFQDEQPILPCSIFRNADLIKELILAYQDSAVVDYARSLLNS